MVDKLRRVMNVPNVREKKKKEKKKESNALCLVIRKREDKVGECMRYIVMKLTWGIVSEKLYTSKVFWWSYTKRVWVSSIT